VIQKHINIKELLKELSRTSKENSHFTRVSCYIDGFYLGQSAAPIQEFYRIMELNYIKDTSRDAVISFLDGRGQIMKEAFEKNDMIFRRGQDKAWFCVLPVGKHACINLSNHSQEPAYLAHESAVILRRLLPSLRVLDSRFMEIEMMQGIALQKVRANRGHGQWNEEIGSIFLDINDYSKHSENYGKDFNIFVSATYIPALVKIVSHLAAFESLIGDEVYLVVLKDVFSSELSTTDATFQAVSLIDDFVYAAGAELCRKSGYQMITLSIGVNVGVAAIISDSFRVRTTGRVINEAKRMLDEAGKAGILVHSQCTLPLQVQQKYSLSEIVSILNKKNFILARRLLRI
jgi:class 3 adenylate cyclase